MRFYAKDRLVRDGFLFSWNCIDDKLGYMYSDRHNESERTGYCVHGNRPTSCKRCISDIEGLCEKLLTTEQEGEAMKKKESHPFFKESFAKGDKQIALFGTRHTSKEPIIAEMVQQYREIKPDVIFCEGNDIHTLFPGMTDEEIRSQDPKEVMEKEEQIFIIWQAFKDGKEALSWDLPFHDQLIIAFEKHGQDVVAGWVVTYALGKLYSHHESPSVAKLDELLPAVISQSERNALAERGLDLRNEALEAACKKYTGFDFKELAERFQDPGYYEQDFSDLRALYDPRGSGETNGVLKDMNVARDRHAIKVLHAAKQKYKNIVVFAGGSHVLTWKPAIEEMYK